MPIHDLGGGCYRWGNHGAKYCGPGAREKAMKQMRGAFFNGYKGDGGLNSTEAIKQAVADNILAKEILAGKLEDVEAITFSKKIFTEESAQKFLNDNKLKFDNKVSLSDTWTFHNKEGDYMELRPVKLSEGVYALKGEK